MPQPPNTTDVLTAALDALDGFELRLHQHDLILKDQEGINRMELEILHDFDDRLSLVEEKVVEIISQLKSLKAS